MLQVHTDTGWMPITNLQEYYTEYEYGGEETLHFSVSKDDEIYKYLKEECNIKNNENAYVLKKRNHITTMVSFDGVLDLDDWKQNAPYKSTKEESKFQTKTLNQMLNAIKPNGWTIINATITSIKRTVELECVNDYDVLWALQDIFKVVYKFDTLHKTISIINPENVADEGLYISKELNMESEYIKGDSTNFVTRLYFEGKEGLTFADINNGKDYVECFDYSTKIITARWKDERYTDKQSALNDAKEKIKKLAIPTMAYTVNINDLAQVNPDYDFLDFGLYKVAHVLLNRTTDVIQSVVKYRKFHDNINKNILTFSTEPQRINKQIQQISNAVNGEGTKFQGSIVQHAQMIATGLITSALGGFVVKTHNELFIMDTDDQNTAKKVWRWNINGLGYSSNGIDGPYELAMTANGEIVAGMITTGILRGEYFEFDLDGGVISMGNRNASGIISSPIFKLSQDGLAFKGKITASTISSSEIDASTLTASTITACTITGTNLVSESNGKTVSIESGRASYKADDKEVGFIGSSRYAKDESIKGLTFDLEPDGNYMSFAARFNESDENYLWKFIYVNKGFAEYESDSLNLGCDLYTMGHTIYLDSDKKNKLVPFTSGGSIVTSNHGLFMIAHESDKGHETIMNFESSEIGAYKDLNMHNYKILNQSDERLKKNIRNNTQGHLNIVNALELKSYDWIANDEHVDVGIIAQQVQQVCPSVVSEDVDGILSINSTDLIYHLIGAVQELSSKISPEDKKSKFVLKEKLAEKKKFVERINESKQLKVSKPIMQKGDE